MSNKIAKKKQDKRSLPEKVDRVLRVVIAVALTFYLALLIGVMPFYNSDGYTVIGSDKFHFFRRVTVPMIYVFVPLCVLSGICFLINRASSKSPNSIKTPKQRGKEGIWGLSLTDLGAVLFGVSVLLSFLVSEDKQEALWGATGWYMGLFTQMVMIGLYFLISRFWVISPWLIGLFFPASAVVFLLGVLNRFGIDPLGMDINNPAYISTIGNMNWYCGYVVPIFFACATFIWQSEWSNRTARILFWSYVGIGFATLVTQGSSSGILTLGMMMAVWYGLTGFPVKGNEGKQVLSFLRLALLFAGICCVILLLRGGFGVQMTYSEMSSNLFTLTPVPIVLLVGLGLYAIITWRMVKASTYSRSWIRFLPPIFLGGLGVGILFFLFALILNTVHPGMLGAIFDRSIFTFNPTWGSNRGMTWRTGVEIFKQASPLQKIFGVGPDSFVVFLERDASEALRALVQETFDGSRLTNAHHEWLTILVNEGILGLAGFGLMIVSAIYRFSNHLRNEKTPKWIAGVSAACAMGILAHTINGSFSFQQTMSITSLYLLLGFGEAFHRAQRRA
ncbi:MAG: O-antigen ligase family protein [Lachnospiraceae bacterium]|nr:O-antigen ligase family protein [Lachnospiraceae bacterium]